MACAHRLFEGHCTTTYRRILRPTTALAGASHRIGRLEVQLSAIAMVNTGLAGLVAL